MRTKLQGQLPVSVDVIGAEVGAIKRRVFGLETGRSKVDPGILVSIPEFDSGFVTLYTDNGDGTQDITVKINIPGDTESLRLVFVRRDKIGSQSDYETKRKYIQIDDISDADRQAGFKECQLSHGQFKNGKTIDFIKLISIARELRNNIADPPDDLDYSGYPGNALLSVTIPSGTEQVTSAASMTDNGMVFVSDSQEISSTDAADDGEALFGNSGSAPTLGKINGTANKITSTFSTPNYVLTLPDDLRIVALVADKKTKTSNYTAAQTDFTLLCDATSGNITVTLPAAASNSGRIYVIKKIDASANTVTIDGNASETIDGATTVVLSAQYASKMIQCDGSNWFILSQV